MMRPKLLPMVPPNACPLWQDDELPSVDFVLDIARAAVLRYATSCNLALMHDKAVTLSGPTPTGTAYAAS